jgi:hypothetical protein
MGAARQGGPKWTTRRSSHSCATSRRKKRDRDRRRDGRGARRPPDGGLPRDRPDAARRLLRRRLRHRTPADAGRGAGARPRRSRPRCARLLKARPRCEVVAVTAQIGAVGPLVADFTRFADLAVVLKPYGDARHRGRGHRGRRALRLPDARPGPAAGGARGARAEVCHRGLEREPRVTDRRPGGDAVPREGRQGQHRDHRPAQAQFRPVGPRRQHRRDAGTARRAVGHLDPRQDDAAGVGRARPACRGTRART